MSRQERICGRTWVREDYDQNIFIFKIILNIKNYKMLKGSTKL